MNPQREPDRRPDETVLVHRDGHVAVVTLNRPRRRNAWTVAMQAAYHEALAELEESPDVRCIVVTGAGGHFCPGADFAALGDYAGTGTTNPAAGELMHPEWFPIQLRTPLVAAVEGSCAGVGLVQALMCDLRVMAEGVRVSTAFAQRALPAMHGAEWLLRDVVGSAQASRLLLVAEAIDAAECLRIGLAHELVSSGRALDRAMSIARQISCSAPQSVSTIKGQLSASRSSTLPDAVERVEAWIDGFLSSPDFRESVRAVVARDDPWFTSSTLDGR